MKNARQTAILSIIEHNDIETQEDLAARLRDMGIMVTQATVSRDIKELRLLKVLTPSGVYKYATAAKAEHGVSERLVRMFIDSVLSITYAENLVVIHTPGLAAPMPLPKPSTACDGLKFWAPWRATTLSLSLSAAQRKRRWW